MLSAGESSASYRWIPACVSQSYDVCVCLDVLECVDVSMSTQWHIMGTEYRTPLCRMPCSPWNIRLNPCILFTGGMILWNAFFFFFFITDPRGVGSVVSRAICPAARPLRVLVPVPGCVFTGIIQQQIVYLLHVSWIFCSILKPDRNTRIPSTLISHFNGTPILTKWEVAKASHISWPTDLACSPHTKRKLSSRQARRRPFWSHFYDISWASSWWNEYKQAHWEI